MAKKTEGWNIVGLNYKDDLEKAFKWLDQYGNPYSVNLYDQDGEYGFSLGVSGAPETYLLKEDKILQKHIGIMIPICFCKILSSLSRYVSGAPDTPRLKPYSPS